MKLTAHGIDTDLPPGWEGRITRRIEPVEPDSPTTDGPTTDGRPADDAPPDGRGPNGETGDGTTAAGRTAAGGTPGERTRPVVHLANFALPEDRGDYGSGAVDVMGDGHVLVVLFEFGPESVGRALFAPQGLPRKLTPAAFDPRALQRTLEGQSGHQSFFTEAGRAFCLYVVLGSHRAAPTLVPQANAVLAATTIGPR